MAFGGIAVFPGHGHGDAALIVIHAPQGEVAGELRVFVGAVGAHLAGGIQHIAHLQLAGAILLAVGQSLGGEVGLVLLAVGDLLQHDNRAAGAEDAVGGHTALDVHQDGVILIPVQVAQLEPVVQGCVGEGAGVAVGVELGGVHVHRQLAFPIGLVGPVRIAGNQAIGIGAHAHILAAVVVLQVDAAPQGDRLVGKGRAVGPHQVQLRLGSGHQGDGVERIELELGSVPLAAGKGLLGDGAQIGVGSVAGAELHIAGNAIGLVDNQKAVLIGWKSSRLALAGGVGDGGLLGRGGLEHVELVLEGLHIHGHGVAHAGGGVGGGDRDALHVGSGGDGHLGLGQVGLIGQVLDVVPQAALAVVDGHVFRVTAQGPPDAVPEAAPVVRIGVDAHIRNQAQLLAQRHDVIAFRGKLASSVHLGRIVQGDAFHILAIGLDGQGISLVDIEDQGVRAGGEVGARGLRVLCKGDGVGVVKGAI